MSNLFDWLTPQVFYQFANEVGLDLKCKACVSGPPQHFLDTGWDDGYIPRSSAYTTTDTGYVNMAESRHVSCVRITCAHCGHIDLYSFFIIERWKDRKVAAEQNSTPSLFPPGTISG